MKNAERTIFALRDKKFREATPEEIRDDRIPPEVSEIIILKGDGTWTSSFVDPSGR